MCGNKPVVFDKSLVSVKCEECFDELINPLNTELNPICHLLALLGVHHFLYVSRIRVN